MLIRVCELQFYGAAQKLGPGLSSPILDLKEKKTLPFKNLLANQAPVLLHTLLLATLLEMARVNGFFPDWPLA